MRCVCYYSRGVSVHGKIANLRQHRARRGNPSGWYIIKVGWLLKHSGLSIPSCFLEPQDSKSYILDRAALGVATTWQCTCDLCTYEDARAGNYNSLYAFGTCSFGSFLSKRSTTASKTSVFPVVAATMRRFVPAVFLASTISSTCNGGAISGHRPRKVAESKHTHEYDFNEERTGASVPPLGPMRLAGGDASQGREGLGWELFGPALRHMENPIR